MCGRCRHVFDAFQSLARITESGPAYDAQTLATQGEAAAATEANVESATIPTEFSDSLFLREEPSALPADFTLPLNVWTENPSVAAEVSDDQTMPLLTAASTAPAESQSPLFSVVGPPAAPQDEAVVVTRAIGMSADSSILLDEDDPPVNNPLLARAAQSATTSPSSRVWGIGAGVLFVALLAQTAYSYRAEIARWLPATRPALTAACEQIGCVVHWGRDESAIRIEASDLLELPGKNPRIQLTSTLANRSQIQQDFPLLELRLTDSANQVLVKRILMPQEYLGRAPTPQEGLAPASELFVNLQVQLTTPLSASGYAVRAFYAESGNGSGG